MAFSGQKQFVFREFIQMECNRDAFCFAYDNPNDFHKILGQKSEKPSKIMFVFRGLEILYSYAVLIWIFCLAFLAPHLKIFTSYCTWAQILFSVSVEMGFGKSVDVLRKTKEDANAETSPKLPWYSKVYWAAFSAALPALVVSCVTFWTQIYQGKPEMIYIFMSNVTLLVILCEFIMIAFPLRLLYFFYFLVFIYLYIIFTVIYQSIGGFGVNKSRVIYNDLDWKNSNRALTACLIAICIGEAAFFFFWAINRMIISKMFCRKE